MDSIEIQKTGKHVDLLVQGLIESADDKNQEVLDAISNALLRLSKQHVNLVLSSCLNYIVSNLRDLTQEHRVTVLRMMERVVKEMVEEMDDGIAASLVKRAAAEMISSKDMMPEWQTAASDLIVAAGNKYTHKIMEELMLHLNPGVLPHYFVILTLGKLAVANAYEMVPFITGVMGTMLPMLGLAKQDNLRWVFAHTISKFAESILYYVENLDQAPDKNVTISAFYSEFYSAYDMLFSVWLPQSKDKLRVMVVRALGHVSYVISKDNLRKEIGRLIPCTISLYRKHPLTDHLVFTETLCMMLDAVTQDDYCPPDPFFENITNPLHTFICMPIDCNKKEQVINQNELLRCFAMINRVLSDKLVASVLQRLEVKDEKVRAGALLVIKHLVNSGGAHMEVKKALIISGLRIMCQEPSLKVRRVFAQTIISMAHHGYLELDGGELMIEFIIRQCTLADSQSLKKPVDPDYVTSQALRSMCESVLQLIVTTIDIMEQVLWPYLLEFIIPVQYTDAFSVICKSLTVLAERKRERNDADYLIDYEDEANLPNPESLLTRMFVIAGIPMSSRSPQRGEHVLKAMMALVPNLHQDLISVWDDVIPKLLSKLEELQEEDSFKQKKWDDLLLRLLSTSLNTVDCDQWTIKLGESFGKQLALYKKYPLEKSFCLKCMGIVLRKVQHKDFIQSQLELMFSEVDHTNTSEQEGLAIAYGYTAAAHFDVVLTKLELKTKSDGSKKSSGIIGFLKEKVNTTDNVMEATPSKRTIMLAYGYACFYAPISLVTSRIEAVVFRNISPYFPNQKDLVLKMNLILTIELIGKSVHPLHIQKTHNLSQRSQFITYLMSCLEQEPKDKLANGIKRAVFDACASLVQLDPALPPADSLEMLTVSLRSVLSLHTIGARKGKADTYDQQVAQEDLMKSTLASLETLMQELLVKNFSGTGLENMVSYINTWINSEKDNERERTTNILRSLITYYLTNIESCNTSEPFTVLGDLIGRLVPRCTDPSIEVREDAIFTIQSLLRIQLIYEGGEAGATDKMLDALPILNERLHKSESTILFSAVKDLAKVLIKKIPSTDQFLTLIDVLVEGLCDVQPLCSNGACVVLNSLIKQRGEELKYEVSSFLSKLHVKIPHCVEATTTGALRCVLALAGHHLQPVIQALLKYPLPYDSVLAQYWEVIGKDPALCEQTFNIFLDLLKQNMPYEERTSSVDRKVIEKIATPLPLAIVMAMKHMLVPETKEVVAKLYHNLLTALLLKMGSYSGAIAPLKPEEPKPASETSKASAKQQQQKSKTPPAPVVIPLQTSAEAMLSLLQLTASEDMLNYMNDKDIWSKLCSHTDYISAIEQLALIVAKYQTDLVPAIVESLTPSLSGLFESDRIVSTAFFSQLIHCRCGGNMALVEVLIGSLMGRLVDSCIIVRQRCVKGLGNVADTGIEMVQKYSTTVISALVSAMDDKDDFEDEVTGEAMTGLSKILTISADESHVRPILINIALKIRPCFAKNQTSVRAAAFRLFGTLAKFGNGPSAKPFLEQIHNNLTVLLLHLNDHEEEVVLACKHSLKMVGPLLNSDGVNEMFQKYLLESAQLHYGEFLNDLCKILVHDLKDKIPFFVITNVTYFKSQWAAIRCNAAIYLGFLMSALPEGSSNIINQDHVCNALLALLRDRENPEVRSKAAEAISLLSSY
ncbi:maestro heat-like repeat-containing protein family member 1 [Watersipora subatra]|uniref:maestro heat-like repeat-containing protein family member 1 n=1 Tax=Watersipora subatra TaxID=2589382 RepID=UPI00355B1A11